MEEQKKTALFDEPPTETIVIDGCTVRIRYSPETEERVHMEEIQKILWENMLAG